MQRPGEEKNNNQAATKINPASQDKAKTRRLPEIKDPISPLLRPLEQGKVTPAYQHTTRRVIVHAPEISQQHPADPWLLFLHTTRRHQPLGLNLGPQSVIDHTQRIDSRSSCSSCSVPLPRSSCCVSLLSLSLPPPPFFFFFNLESCLPFVAPPLWPVNHEPATFFFLNLVKFYGEF